jgi:Dyp-type peroxidase family
MSYDPNPPGPPVPPPVDDLPLRHSTEIQGNILAGFNKDHQFFAFLQFADTASGREWLNELRPRIATTEQVATFNEQFSEARRARGGDDPEELKAVWVNLGLSSHGITMLSPRLGQDLNRFEAFTQGPVTRAPQLRDRGLSDPSRWVVGGPGQQTIDAVLTIAADDPEDLSVEIDKQRTLATKHGLLAVFEQRGNTLPGHRAGHEHFGFKDGISQPGVRGFHPVEPSDPDERLGHPGTEMIQPGEFVIGHLREDGTTQAEPAWMIDGSFQVFRRLQQDVPGWWAQVTARKHSLPSDDPMKEDLLAAKLVGRWRSGTPLAHAPLRDNRSSRNRERDNDFDYDDDPDGHKTPRFSHIRKVYPRDERFGDDRRRIMRRGIPFGLTFDPAAGRGHGVDADRGLLFNVFMSSIEDQFEFLQQTWANNPGFQQPEEGPDPIIGDADRPSPVTLRRQDLPERRFDFERFVHTSGAIYLFAPSLTTLRNLAEGRL